MHNTPSEAYVIIAVATGHTSNKLIVIDYDNPHAFDLGIAYCIRQHNALFAAETRRGGHLYVFCTNSSIPSQDYKKHDVEIKSDGRYVVGPGSIFIDENGQRHEYKLHKHNTGIPTLTPDEIARMVKHASPSVNIRIGRNTTRKQSSDSPGQRYDDDTRDYLANGHTYREGIRNESMVHACRVMLAYGDAPDTVYDTLYSIAIQSGLSENEVKASLNHQIKNFDPSKMRGGVQYKTDSTLQIAKQVHAHYAWGSESTNTTTQAVLRACITMSKREYGQAKFRVANREIAELASVGRSTANRHLRILVSIGALKLSQNDTTGTSYAQWDRNGLTRLSACYAPTSRDSFFDNESFDFGTVVRSTTKLEENTVPFSKKWIKALQERTGLGHRTLSLYVKLFDNPQPLTIPEIANYLGVTYNVAYYHVGKLLELQLITQDGKCYTAVVNDIRLAKLASIGTMTATARKKRHTYEQFSCRVRLIIQARKKYDPYYVNPHIVNSETSPSNPDPDLHMQSMIDTAYELGGVVDETPVKQPIHNPQDIDHYQTQHAQYQADFARLINEREVKHEQAIRTPRQLKRLE